MEDSLQKRVLVSITAPIEAVKFAGVRDLVETENIERLVSEGKPQTEIAKATGKS